MKKLFKVQNVDCGHCALKMQNEICKIEGVENATLNFMTQRLTVEYDESKISDVASVCEQACRKIDKEVEIIR